MHDKNSQDQSNRDRDGQNTDGQTPVPAPPHPPALPLIHRTSYETLVEHYRFLQQWDASDPRCRTDVARIRQRLCPHRPTLRELMQWSDLSRDTCRRHRSSYEKDLRKMLEAAGE